MKKITFLAVVFAVFVITPDSLFAQQIYSNGDISTGTPSTNGTAAPAGYTWSELQLPNTILGSGVVFNAAGTTDFALADEFTVPSGEVWDLVSADFYGYQTGYTGTTVPIDAMRVRIWNGDPSLPTSTVVFGDMTTNVLDPLVSGEAFVYRTAATTGTTRKVWKFNAATVTSLTEGVYWIEYQVHATNDGAIFVPPVTILDELSNPDWNAKQRSAAAWANLLDTGSTFNRALSFQLNGTITNLAVNQNELDSKFSVYPNPIVDAFSIKVVSDELVSKVEVISIDGKVLKSVLNQFDVINIGDLASGNYLVKIFSGNAVTTKKIVKQ